MPEIKYSWDRNLPTSTTAYLHVNVLLSTRHRSLSNLEIADPKSQDVTLLQAIGDIHGVQEASVERYKIRIERTSVVEWGPICDAVETAIKTHCAEQNITPPDCPA
jgi:hypothetical protein